MDIQFDLSLILFVAVVGVAVLLFELGLLRTVYSEEEQKKRHLKKRLANVRASILAQAEDDELLRKNLNTNNTAFAKFILKMPGGSHLNSLIDRTGQKTTLSRTIVLMIGLSIVSGAVTWFVTKEDILSGIIALAAFLLPILVLSIAAKKRLETFDEQLPEALDIIIRALRAGHPFDGALKVVAEELPEPIADEFSVTSAEINYGVTISGALNDMVRRVPSKQLRSFVTAVLVQKETGGNLAEILENISSVIRGGFKFQRKLRTLSAEGRMSIAVLAGMPIFLGMGLYLVNRSLIIELFTNPKGNELLYGVVVLFTIGFIWSKKIIKIEV